MSISDFETLELARLHPVVVDKKQVGAGQARGYFVKTGIWSALKVIQADMTHPLFALADAIIVTASDASSYFGLDSSTDDGKSVLESADILVAQGIMTEVQKTELLSKSLTTTYPYAKLTHQDFERAKGREIYAQVTPIKGWLRIITTENCESHRPQIYAEIQGMKRRVAGFDFVEAKGDYLTSVPREYSMLFVDNTYGVIS